MEDNAKIKLAVIFGGRSVEHDISVLSALDTIRVVDREKYDVIPVYMDRDNRFYTGDELLVSRDNYSDGKRKKEMLEKSVQCVFVKDTDEVSAKDIVVLVRRKRKKFGSDILSEVQVVLPIVHGTNVEDGALQGLLRNLDIPFAGCDVLSSAVGMDKYVMKILLKEAGYPVLDCCRFGGEALSDMEGAVYTVEEKFGYPVVVKPVDLGSSIGINMAYNGDDLIKYMEDAFVYADRIIVEPAIEERREINCAVLGDSESASASACEEIISHVKGIYTYEQKYCPDLVNKGEIEKKPLSDKDKDLEREIQELSVNVFKYLGCSGVTRVDLLIDKSDGGKVYVNEINTIPGSLAHHMWERSGLSFTELIDRLVEIAAKRHRMREKLTFKYENNIFDQGGSKGIGSSPEQKKKAIYP